MAHPSPSAWPARASESRQGGIDAEEPDAARLDAALEPLGLRLPAGVDLSTLARQTAADINPMDDPHLALISWMQEEDRLCRRFERRLVASRLTGGFRNFDEPETDGFLEFSRGVQQLRRARTGTALQIISSPCSEPTSCVSKA